MFCSEDGESEFIWREQFEPLVGEDVYNEVVEAVEGGLDNAYKSQAPWEVLRVELNKNGYLGRDWLQITKEVGKRQPTHWDTACPWFKNHRGHWAPLSIVLHINDGLSTYLPGPPANVFTEAEAAFRKGVKPSVLARGLNGVLEKYDTCDALVPLQDMQRSRAGQCLAFHAGHQPHAGMGWDGVKDPVTPAMCGRVVSYFFAIPRRHKNLWTFPLFNPETPWGLMKESITEDMVLFR